MAPLNSLLKNIVNTKEMIIRKRDKVLDKVGWLGEKGGHCGEVLWGRKG